VPILLRALHHLKTQRQDAALVIVGDGPERRDLQELASALGLQESVHFVGWTPYEQLPEFYANADVVAIPSLYEPYGRVIAEAMAFGRAVVATHTEGARDLIRDGETGFVVPLQDVQALARRISYLLKNPQVACTVGAAARQFIKRTQDPEALCAAQVEMWLKVAGQ
jgi:glycosyltransferase involved in cell wall biosynthesis